MAYPNDKELDRSREPDSIGDLIRKMMNITEREAEISRQSKLNDTKRAYESIREENFKKYPALKEAWEQYQLVEKMYG